MNEEKQKKKLFHKNQESEKKK